MSFILLLVALFFLPLNLCQEQQTRLLVNETSTIGKHIFIHTCCYSGGCVFRCRHRQVFVLHLVFISVCLGGALTDASLNNNRLIPKTISEYPSPINVRTKYTSDEEDYTSTESISFALLTNQQNTQATTVLAGFAYDNIYYVFDIEVCFFSFT